MTGERSRSFYNGAISRTKVFDTRKPPAFRDGADRYASEAYDCARIEFNNARQCEESEHMAVRNLNLTRWFDELKGGRTNANDPSQSASQRITRTFDVVTRTGGGERATGFYESSKQDCAAAMRADPSSVTYANGYARSCLLSGDIRGATDAARHAAELAVLGRRR